MKLPRASAVVSTVFGIGYFPYAQGTIMSAIALPLAILIAMFGGGAMGLLGATLIVLVIGILSCSDYVRETGNPDPQECVIDELAGQWLASAFVAFGTVSFPAFFLSFILFRVFDIWKPWPIYLAETKLHGGLAVMMDDIVAGLIAGALAFVAHHYGL
jgi:phosphatidylglycerophosphatase A